MRGPQSKQSEATRGGIYVLAFVACALALGIGTKATSIADRMFIGVVVLGLTFGIYRLHRFIREHGDDIGEARFDTRNREP